MDWGPQHLTGHADRSDPDICAFENDEYLLIATVNPNVDPPNLHDMYQHYIVANQKADYYVQHFCTTSIAS